MSPPWYPVPPTGYGGIERVVALLADSLIEAGHDVTLFASGDSQTTACLVSVFPVAQSASIGVSSIEVAHALACYVRADEFDLINDHSGPPAAALGGLVSTPVLHTVHGPLDGAQSRLYRGIARAAPRVGLLSLSLHQRRPARNLPWIANCPNAVDLDELTYRAQPGDYALFLGRLHPNKGAHRAVEAAARAGVPLVLAGKMHDPDERAYFDAEIRPRLGPAAVYLGEVDNRVRIELLSGAIATLCPFAGEEPFGLVMIESMACGTPVVAYRRGAVPEVVGHGRSGIVVEPDGDLAAALCEAAALDRRDCRRTAEERFSASRMVDDYLGAYELFLESETCAVLPAKPS